LDFVGEFHPFCWCHMFRSGLKSAQKCMNLPHSRMMSDGQNHVFLYQSFLKNRHTELKWFCLKILGTAQNPEVLSSSLFKKLRFLGVPHPQSDPKSVLVPCPTDTRPLSPAMELDGPARRGIRRINTVNPGL
jgi:hypothetical protein